MAKITYRVQAGKEHVEHIVVAKKASTPTKRRCAALVRFGRVVTNFMITPAQLRAYNKGKRIAISSKAIRDFGTWCK